MEQITSGLKYIELWFLVSLEVAIFLGFAFGIYLLLKGEIKITDRRILFRKQTRWIAPLFILSGVLFWLPAFWPTTYFDYLPYMVRLTTPLSLILFGLGVVWLIFVSFQPSAKILNPTAPSHHKISLFWGTITLLISLSMLIFAAYWILTS